MLLQTLEAVFLGLLFGFPLGYMGRFFAIFADSLRKKVSATESFHSSIATFRRLFFFIPLLTFFATLKIEGSHWMFTLILFVSATWAVIMGFERKTYSPLIVFSPKYYFQD